MKMATNKSSSFIATSKKEDDEDYRKRFIAYNKLLQSHMLLYLTKKKIESKVEKVINDINIVNEEHKSIQNELFQLERTILHVESLIKLNLETEKQVVQMEKELGMIEQLDIKNMLFKLERFLESISQLRCNKIKLPQTQEEIQVFRDTIEKCSETFNNFQLENLEKVFKDIQLNKSNFSYDAADVNNKIKELMNTVNELQIIMLKYTSDSLAQI